MAEYIIGTTDDIPIGEKRLVVINGRDIGIFNVEGRYYALPNRCTHQGGPLCEGRISGTLVSDTSTDWNPEWVQEGEILVCPWHSLEFNIKTGRCLAYPRVRLRQYPVSIEEGKIKIRV